MGEWRYVMPYKKKDKSPSNVYPGHHLRLTNRRDIMMLLLVVDVLLTTTNLIGAVQSFDVSLK